MIAVAHHLPIRTLKLRAQYLLSKTGCLVTILLQPSIMPAAITAA